MTSKDNVQVNSELLPLFKTVRSSSYTFLKEEDDDDDDDDDQELF